MKTKWLLTCALLLFSTAMWAQKGILKGRVTDKNTSETLPAAMVKIKGTTIGVTTDLQGIYTLRIPADTTVDVTFSYLGHADTTIAISVAAGETVIQDMMLRPEEQWLTGVVVKGQLQGQARALNQQKNAENIKNVVSAEQIGRFPDQNTAEALQRVSGVNIQRDQGEGRYVLVRGLAPQFTNININGEQIPSPEADVRFVALDAISAQQLSSMEISKTLTPDMDGDAIGGSVNLITKTATTTKPEVKVTLAGGYNNLMQRFNGNGAVQYGQRFGKNEKFGIMVNGNYYTNNLGSNNWEREPLDNEFELRDYELTRTRAGLSGTFDYKINKNSKLYFRSIYSRFTDREWRRAYVFIPEDEEIEKATKDRFEAQSVLALNLGGEHISENVEVDYEVQYSYGEQDTPYDKESVFIAGLPSSIGFSDSDFPSLSAPGYLDNTEYEFDELETGNTLAKDENITAKVNVGIPYTTGKSDGLLKFGAKVRLKSKTFEITQNVYENLGGVPNLDQFEGGLLDDNFLDGKYELSDPLDINEIVSYLNENPEQFELQIEDKAIDEALEAYEATENVYAGYIMSKHQFKDLLLIGGLRYEYTDVTYESKDVIIDPAGDLQEIRDREGGSNYGLLLPQINARYSINDNTNIRAAATYSYSRPNFIDIVPAQEANLEDEEATVGNPMLEPVKAINLDLLGEHYFSNVGIISGGVFYKNLRDFIYRSVDYDSQYPLMGTPVATNIDVTQAINGEDASLVGFEVAFQRKLNFLPSFLKNFSVYANYTYTSSEAQIQSRAEADAGTNATETIDLPGQASHVGNASLAYQNNKMTIRGSLNFNGSYIDEVGGTPEEDIYIDDRMQLDLSLSYFASESTTFFVEWLNMTDQPFEAYQGSEDVVIQREFYGSWFRFGVKVDLSNFIKEKLNKDEDN